MSNDETQFPAQLPDGPESPPPADLPLALPTRRPRVWTVFLAFGLSLALLLLGQVVFAIVLEFWTRGAAERGEPLRLTDTPGWILVPALVFEVLLTAGAMAAAGLSLVRWRERLSLRATGLSWLGVIVSVAGVLAIGQDFESLIELGLLPESPALEAIGQFVSGLSGWSLVGGVLVIGIAPGIAEEVMFRGYIQTRLVERWGAGWGILWTSLLFGIIHLDLIHGTFAFAMGLFLGYLTVRTGSIRAAMICHAANNTVSTLTTAWGLGVFGFEANVAASCLAVTVLALCLWYLRRLPSKPFEARALDELAFPEA